MHQMTVEFFLFPSLGKASISRLEQLFGYRSSQAVSPRMKKAAVVTAPTGNDEARRQERELYATFNPLWGCDICQEHTLSDPFRCIPTCTSKVSFEKILSPRRYSGCRPSCASSEPQPRASALKPHAPTTSPRLLQLRQLLMATHHFD